MSTTTIRLPDDLRLRLKKAAQRAGTTTHHFILQAIAEKAQQQAAHDEFNDEADARYADILASGKTIAWADMRSYLQGRAAGGKVKKPQARKLAR